MSRKLDLKIVLAELDAGNKDFFSSLDEDLKKEFSPYVIMRYMSSSANYTEHHLIMVNDFVNDDYSVFAKHPEMLWKLLCLCSTGRKQFHPWIKPPKGKKADKLSKFLMTAYPFAKPDEIEMIKKINTSDELKELAKSYGYTDKEIKELFTE